MALEAHKLYKQIADEEGIEFDKVEKGIHTFTLQMKNLILLKQTNNLYRTAGLDRWEVKFRRNKENRTALSNPT